MGFVNKRSISSITIGGETIYGGEVELNVPGGSLDPETGQINIPTGSSTVETFVLDATDISNKYIVLTAAPATASSTRVEVKGLDPKFYGDDFTMTTDDGGKRLSWSGLGLDGVLIVGDKLNVIY